MRSRTHPWGLPSLSGQLQTSAEVGSILMVRFLRLCVAVQQSGGFFFMEHPEDPGQDPYPSIWATELWATVADLTGARVVSFDQGALGAPARKGTTIGASLGVNSWVPGRGLDRFRNRRVAADQYMPGMIGKTADGKFRTSALQVYPPKLNTLLADCFGDSLDEVLVSSSSLVDVVARY